MMNIKFEYLYRDAGNYKRCGQVVFANPIGLSLAQIEPRMRQMLIDGEYILASEVNLPTLYFATFDPELDHSWHEFSGVEETEELPNDYGNRTIAEFMTDLGRSYELVRN